MARKKLFVIDVMAMAFRSFFAFSRTTLSTRDGTPTGAIYGCATFLNKVLVEEKPDYFMAAMESKEPNFRLGLYPAYKAHRDEMPADLRKQLPLLFQLFEKMRCPLVSISGYEADDVIGAVAKRFAEEADIYIVSGDKDFMQLINDRVWLYAPKKGEEAALIGREGVFEKFRVGPEHVVDCLALIGDTSDNVPGVPGIGEKTAAKLISTYGSLEGLYENLDDIKGKQHEALKANRDNAFLSRDLVTIATDITLPVGLGDLECNPDVSRANPELLAFFEELEFRTLAAKIKEVMKGPAKAAAPKQARQGEFDFGATSEDTADEAPKVEVRVANDAFAWTGCAASLQPYKELVTIVWPEDPDVVTGRPAAIFLKAIGGPAWWVRWTPVAQEGLAMLLDDPSRTLIAHDWKPQIQRLWNGGVRPKAKLFDTMLADYLIDPNANDHAIGKVSERHLGEVFAPPFRSFAPLTGTPEDLAATGAYELVVLERLFEVLKKSLENDGLLNVMHDIEMPLLPVLAAMEHTGVFIDADFLAEFSNELNESCGRLQSEIWEIAGGEFNIQSPKQLQEVLFERLKVQEVVGLKRLKKTKTGWSTDESVLSKLADHPIVSRILDYREVVKLKNTYVDPLPQHINPHTKRLHTTFRQSGTATGRLSSDNPNLQNIPMRSAQGQRIRKAFVPQEKGWVLLSADYSQIEIRLLAHLANEPHLIRAFAEGLDIHRATAARVMNVPLDQVTPAMRSQAKAINFGILYGMGPQRLARETGTTMTEAKEFIEKYFAAYPGIRQFLEGLVTKAKELGFSETMMGRRRPILGLTDQNQAIAARAQNIATNAPIQGSAADLIKIAMIRTHRFLKEARLSAKFLLQVHDELLFEVPEHEVDRVKDLVKEAMEHAMETRVPLEVSVGVGKDWLDAH